MAKAMPRFLNHTTDFSNLLSTSESSLTCGGSTAPGLESEWSIPGWCASLQNRVRKKLKSFDHVVPVLATRPVKGTSTENA